VILIGHEFGFCSGFCLQNPALEFWLQNSQRPSLEKSKSVDELLLGQALEAEFEGLENSAAL